MRVLIGLRPPVELPLHRGDVDDVLIPRGDLPHEGFQPRIEDIGGDRINQVHLEQLNRGDLLQGEPPAVLLAQIDLLKIRVQRSFGKHLQAVLLVSFKQGLQGELGGVVEPHRVPLLAFIRKRSLLLMPQGIVPCDDLANGGGQGLHWLSFCFNKMRIEIRRTADRLAGVVEQKVQSRISRVDVRGERLDTGRMAQMKAIDMQTI